MLISEISNRDDVLSTVIKELNGIGIKIRNEKPKQSNNKRRNKKIFNISLHLLDLDDGLLSNGSVAQIPKFVLMSCKRIQMDLETEGLFRKTGSVKKQKSIQEDLEHGGSLDRTHHVVDVANLLKTFFRELPEPLIPPGAIQEGLLRCLFQFNSYEEKVDAMLMLMLLLPPISVNTLAYFLQFLEVVIKHVDLNLMTSDNLVKVLTPTIMPVPTGAPQKRLLSHFKVVELLIENANLLGVVPDRMCKRENHQTVPPMTDERKKKKRRSGSLGRTMFNGFRKIVGVISSSSESLDKSTDLLEDDLCATPAAAAKSKKRPLEKIDVTSMSSKKKRDMTVLSSLPEIDDPNSPSGSKKDVAKSRKSVGPVSPTKESVSPAKRRWSIVGSKFTRSTKNHATTSKQEETGEPMSVDEPYQRRDDGVIKISRSEYEAFKDRLVSIENKISHEFNLTKLDSLKAEMNQDNSMLLNGPEKVQNKFNMTLQEVGKLREFDKKAEQIARRLSRDLNIQGNEHGVTRSPSARKIGSLRRRRDSASRLSRNKSWHLGQSSPSSSSTALPLADDPNKFVSTASFYPKSNLKRCKPVQAVSRPLPALPVEQPEKVVPEKPLRVKRESTDHFKTPLKSNIPQPEIWTPAADFFNENKNEMAVDEPPAEDMFFKTPVRPRHLSSSLSAVKNESDLVKTPMLPPRMTPAKRFTPSASTPTKFTAINRSLLHTPLNDASQGRESIIFLRNKNAGMVAQKAKLFNGLLSDKNARQPVKIPRAIVNKNLENVKSIMAFDKSPKKNRRNVPSTSSRSPRRSPRSPVGITKRSHKASSKSPMLKTIRECSEKQKVRMLNPEIVDEIATPKRKPLSHTNSRTPNSGKKRRGTPSKSPRFVRRALPTD